MEKVQYCMNSKVGALYLVASAKALHGVFWDKQTIPVITNLKNTNPEVKIIAQTVKELEEYLDGKRKKFEVPLSAEGTAFQKQVWNQLSKIPYGKTFSYKEVASKIKRGKAFRAVGTANGKNPHSIIVPCHRVITASGTIGGYGGGLKIKKALLKIENVEI